MYQALYRKYRPRAFSDVTGQDHVTVTLRRQIISGRHSHAYLFVGTRGTGKTTCAKILSRAINCLNPIDGDPCNKCPSCIGIENGSILDVLELDAASNNGVDDVRALRDEAIYSPATVNKRIYIIDEAHMLSTPAFNALLKILEEPPEHLVFILATTALHKVPATILSRCQRFSFKRISPAAITERLHFVAGNEGLTLTADAAKELAALADGSMRDALSLLDQCASDTLIDLQRVLDTIGLAGRHEILNLVQAVSVADTEIALGIVDKAYNDGRDMSSLLSEMASLIRDALVYILSPDSPLLSGGFNRVELSSLSANVTPERLFSYLEVIRGALLGLSRGVSIRLTVEMSIIRMCDDRLCDDSPALLSRVAALESAVESGIPNSEFRINAENTDSGQYAPDTQRSEGRGANNAPPIDDAAADVQPYNDTPPVPNSESQIPSSEHAEGGGFWQRILEQFKNDMSIYSLLSDSSRVQAERQDSVLIIRVGDMFTNSLIESKKFSDPLKNAAREILGPDAVVRIEVGCGETENAKGRRIDDLNKFSIVKFE